MAISTNGAIITRLAGALYNEYLSNASYLEVSTTAPATVAANFLSNDFAGKTDAELATTILTNLGLTTVAGLDNWVAAQLTAAGTTAAAKGAALVGMLNSYANMTADATYGASATSFNAKVAASLTASQTDGAAGGSFGTSDAVVVTDATIALTSSLDYLVGSDGGGAGNDSFLALTSGQLATGDVITGGNGTDTLTSRHTITEALTIAPDLNSVEVVKVRLDADGGAADAVSYSLSDVVGVTEVQSYRSVNSGSTADPVLTFSGTAMTTGVTLAIVGGDTGADNSSVDITATYQSVTGTADSSNLRLDGAAANVVTIAGIETLNITATTGDKSASTTGASTIKTLTAENAKTVNINAAGTTTFSATNFATVVTVDATASTGSVRVTAESSSALTFKGGAGNDKVTFGAITELTVLDSINGGAGTADVIVTSSTSLDSTALAALQTYTKNIERLELTATGSSTIDYADLAIFDTVVLGTASSISAAASNSTGTDGTVARIFTGVENSDAIVITAAQIGGAGGTGATNGDAGNGAAAITLTPELDNGSNAVTITLSADLTGGAGGAFSSGFTGGSGGDGGAAISASSFETVNIITAQDSTSSLSAVTLAGGAGGLALAALTGAASGSAGSSVVVGTNGKIVVSGAVALDLGTVAGTNVTVDGSAMTKALTVAGESGANQLTGGSGNDVLTGNLGLDTYTLGEGSDRVVIGLGSNSTASDADASGSSFENVTDWSISSDVLRILNTSDATITLSVLQDTTATAGNAAVDAEGIATFAVADDTFAERLTAVEAATSGGSNAGEYVVFSHGGSTYVFVSDGTDAVTAGDIVVKLTGVTGVTATTITTDGYLQLS